MNEPVTIMTAFTTAIGDFWSICSTTWSNVTANAVWLVPFAVPIAGVALSFTKRLVRIGSGRRR